MEFFVARLLNEYEIIISGGSNQGIKIGSKFKLSNNIDVVNPKTNKLIGTMHTDKGIVKVTKIFPNMCVCEDIKNGNIYTIESHDLNPNKSSLEDMINHKNRLNVDMNQLADEYTSSDRAIRVGDKAELII